jgi:phosphate transport system permease protein
VGGSHFPALFAIALVLFIVTFIFNIVAEIISRNFRIKLGMSQ